MAHIGPYELMTCGIIPPAGGGLGVTEDRKKVMIVAKLTAKQQRFCDEYLVDLDGTKAAIRAGYSEKTAAAIASENLRKPYIREYIDQRMAEKEETLVAKQDEVMKYLTSVLRGESISAEIVVEGLGGGLSRARMMEKEPSEKDRLKAAEMLGKAYGMFTDSVNLTGAAKVVIVDDLDG